MREPDKQNSGLIISFSDIWIACKRAWIKIFLGALLFGCMAVSFVLSKPVEYAVMGTFQQGSYSSGMSSSTLQFLGGLWKGGGEIATPKLMLTEKVLGTLVEKFNLQGSIAKKGVSNSFYQTARDNLKIIYSKWAGKAGRALLIPDINKDLRLTDLVYLGEFGKSLKVKFVTELDFDVFDNEDNFVTTGTLGSPITGDNYSFILQKNNRELLTGSEYGVSFCRFEQAVAAIKSRLDIQESHESSSILEISFSDRDRFFATEIVNSLMLEYTRFLKRKSYEKTGEQLAYLERRQEETEASLEELMTTHKQYLEENLTTGTFARLDEELNFLTKNQGGYRERLSDLDLEKKMLDSVKSSPELFTLPVMLVENSDLGSMTELRSRYRDLKQRREIVHNALYSSEKSSESLLFHQDSLKNINLRMQILQKQFNNYLDSEKNRVCFKEELVEKQAVDLSNRMGFIPEKWFLETKLKTKMEMASQIMDKVTGLVESTVVRLNLESNDSEPLDFAVPPIVPKRPKVFLFFFLSSVIGACLCSCYFVLRSFSVALIVTPDNLKLEGVPVLGKFHSSSLSQILDSDKSLIWKAIKFLSEKPSVQKVVGAFSNQGLEFSLVLSDYFSIKGEKVIHLDCSKLENPCKTDSTNTLYQYLTEDSAKYPTVDKKGNFHQIHFGSSNELEFKLFHSKRFTDLLDSLQQDYDRVILHYSGAPFSHSAVALMEHIDTALINLKNETIQELKEYRSQVGQEQSLAMLFI